ncbi:MAG: chemotaxis protein CheW [Myxococcus sp.]|nr:chemotaxis protein CheW [Myxococcus sp.]
MSVGRVDFARLYERLAEAEQALANEDSPARREAVLSARAQALARPRAEAAQLSLTVMAFTVAARRLAVPFSVLEQVVECRQLCALPRAPRGVLGALAVRTGVVPVLDLRVMLALPELPLADLQFVLVVSAGDERFGLAVEETHGAMGFEAHQLLPPPGPPFRAATTGGVLVLDVDRLGAA